MYLGLNTNLSMNKGPVFSAFIGSVTTCYYLSQCDLVGAFNVAYGYRWWLGALLVLIAAQRALQMALRGQSVRDNEVVSKHDNAFR